MQNILTLILIVTLPVFAFAQEIYNRDDRDDRDSIHERTPQELCASALYLENLESIIDQSFFIPRILTYGEKEIEDAISLTNRTDAQEASEELNISKELLLYWAYLDKNKKDIKTIEKRTRIVLTVLRLNRREASKFLDISIHIVEKTMKQYTEITSSF